MGSYLSPGVYIEERDMSNNVVAPATSVGAYVGRAVWGPPMTRTLVTNEREFVQMFGEPTEDTYKDFFTVSGFFKYGQAMYFVRAVNEANAANANLDSFTTGVSAGSGDYISDWENQLTDLHDAIGSVGANFSFFAKYPGAKGNTDIKVGLMNYTAFAALTANIYEAGYESVSGMMNVIEYGPEDPANLDTSVTERQYVVLVQVLNTDGEWEFAEQFLVSTKEGAKDAFGNNIFIEQAINSKSNYIIAVNNSNLTTEALFFDYTLLSNGADDAVNWADGDIITGYDLFSNPEEIEINYLIGGNNIASNFAVAISDIAQARKDCFSLHDVPYSDLDQSVVSQIVSDVISFRTSDLSALNTSYSALYANWLYVYDKYNDKNRWVPSTGFVAGIYANTADVADSWFAPAGFNRGVMRGVIKTKFNPNKAYRDQMYQKQVNPIVNFPGQGIVVWGQKTLQTKPSSFDRVNVRLLFLYMEKSISKSAQYMVFEQNDSLLRATFLNMVEPFLTDIKGRRGIYDFFVDVSDKVNTPEVIDQNQFRAEIYVKPTRAAEAIIVRFNATKTSVNFSEFA